MIVTDSDKDVNQINLVNSKENKNNIMKEKLLNELSQKENEFIIQLLTKSYYGKNQQYEYIIPFDDLKDIIEEREEEIKKINVIKDNVQNLFEPPLEQFINKLINISFLITNKEGIKESLFMFKDVHISYEQKNIYFVFNKNFMDSLKNG